MPSSACKTCALRSEEHTSELQSHDNLVRRLLLEKKNHPLMSTCRGHGQRQEAAARPRARGGERARRRDGLGGERTVRAGGLGSCSFFFKEQGAPRAPPLPPRPAPPG